jgi:hypothetical protein
LPDKFFKCDMFVNLQIPGNDNSKKHGEHVSQKKR